MSSHRPISASPKLFKSIKDLGIEKGRVSLVWEQFKSKMNWENANKILDIGCGPGDVTVNDLFSQASEHAEMIAVDISPDMVKLANETFHDPRLKFELGDISDPKFGENYKECFDIVFSAYCLHFIQNQWQAMKNIYDVLKPGGETLLIILATHPFTHMDQIIAKKEKWAPYMQHVKETTSPYYNIENPDDKLKNLLLEVGFHIEDCYLSTETRTAPSKEILFEFARGVNPHFSRIPGYLHKEYFEECQRELISNTTLPTVSDTTGEVSYSYTRLIAFARKPARVS